VDTKLDTKPIIAIQMLVLFGCARLCQSQNYETMIVAVRNDDPSKLADTIAAHLLLSIAEKQECWKSSTPPNGSIASPTFLTSRSKRKR
jgi:hypothetical protein